ncbi:MAG: glycosyltransferase family 4 protein [Gemmatimonadaceae bacterium]
MSGSTSVKNAPAARRLRVCLVGPSLDILGGQAVQLERLRAGLSESSVVEVGFLPVNPRLPGPFRHLQRLKYVRTVATSVAYLWSLLRRVGHYDIVHAFSASYWSYVLAPLPAMLVGRLYGKAVILNYHSGEAEDHLARWRHTAVPTMRLAHAIVVPSEYLVAPFARYGLRARPVLNFVELEKISFRCRVAPRPIFLSNRNLEPLYNVACTLRAFGLIQRDYPDATLIVAGEGSSRASLESLAVSLQLRNVEFVGRTPHEQMGGLYDRADIYLNSSNIDNMPLSIIEAFAAGLPVVTTDAGGIPFIVRDCENGLLVPREDHRAMAAAVLRLLREPSLATRLASTGRDECLSKYVWPAVRKEWERVYQTVDAQARGDRPSAAVARSA